MALGYAADGRDYTVAAQMLHALGESRVDLLTNNPDKATQLERHGVTVATRVPTGVHLSPANGRYLAAKASRGAHTLDPGAYPVPPSTGLPDLTLFPNGSVPTTSPKP